METETAEAKPVCEGCRRHAKNPRHTLRFWASYDDGHSEEGDFATGSYWHVDPSGSSWKCASRGGGAMSAPENPALFELCQHDTPGVPPFLWYGTNVTLRDLFAALHVFSSAERALIAGYVQRSDQVTLAALIRYENADAMLAAREAKP